MNNYVCLMYHKIASDNSKYSIDKHKFISQLELVKKNELRGLSLKAIKSNENLSNIISITFDDGNQSDVWVAEELAKYGFLATFFVIEDFIKGSNPQFMNANDVRYISSLGHEIGVHGKNHNVWTVKTQECLLDELIGAKTWLEDLTGREVVSCSAPGGKLNNKIIKTLMESNNFNSIRNSIPYLNSYLTTEINSTVVLNSDSSSIFEKKINGDIGYYNYLFIKQKIKDYAKQILNR